MPCSAAYGRARALVAARDGHDLDALGGGGAREDRAVDVRGRQQAESHEGAPWLRFDSGTGLMCGGGTGRHVRPSPGGGGRLADLAERLVVQHEVGRGHPTGDVFRQARPDDTRGDARLRQHPGDGKRGQRRAEPFRDLGEPLDEREVLGEQRLVERGSGAAPVVLAEGRRCARGRRRPSASRTRAVSTRAPRHRAPPPTERRSRARRGRAAREAAAPRRRGGPPRSGRAVRRRSCRPRSSVPCPRPRARPSSPRPPRAASRSSSRASAPGRGRCAPGRGDAGCARTPRGSTRGEDRSR